MATKRVDLGWVVIDRSLPGTRVIARAMVREAGVIGQIANHGGADACTVQLERKADYSKFSPAQLFELFESLTGTKHKAEVANSPHDMIYATLGKDVWALLKALPLDTRTLEQLEAESARKGVNRHVPEAKSAAQTGQIRPTREAKEPRAPRAPREKTPPTPPGLHRRPPPTCMTGLVWVLADEAEKATAFIVGSKELRLAVLAKAAEHNLNPNMAATQYSRWVNVRKSEGV